jgi:hypothetical protein
MVLGPFFDPLGEIEPKETLYTLTVHKPPRPAPKYLPAIITRTPVSHPFTRLRYTIKPDIYGSRFLNDDDFSEKDFAKMPTKTMQLKA